MPISLSTASQRFVLDAGTREVASGKHLYVGTLATNATVGGQLSNVWAQVTFSEAFSSAPVVLSQVQSDDDPHWVTTRAGTAPALRSGTPPRRASQ